MGCTFCRLHVNSRHVCVGGDGPTSDVDLMIVGESLGEQESNRGKCFVGKTGSFLRAEERRLSGSVAKRLGRSPRVRYTNAVRCYPGNYNKWIGLNPCRQYLVKEIDEIRPRRIIALGSVSASSILGEKVAITNMVEGWSRVDFDGFKVPVQFLIHPSAVLRSRSMQPTWKDQFRKAFMTRPSDDLEGLEGVDVIKVESVSEALDIFKRASKSDICGFDVEAVKSQGRMMCYALSFEDNTAYSFPEEIVNDFRVIEGLGDLFCNGECEFVAHNWKFDANACIDILGISGDVFKVDEKPWNCTMTLSTLYNPERSASLEDLEWLVGLGGHKKRIKDLLGSISGKEKVGPKYGKAYDKDPETMLWYCGGDSIATRRLLKWFRKRLKDLGLGRAIKGVAYEIQPAFLDIERRGVKVDKESLKDLGNDIDGLLSIETEALRSFPEVKRLRETNSFDTKTKKNQEFNPSSPEQVSKVLFSKDGIGLPPVKINISKKTGKKSFSTDESVRKVLVDKHPIMKHLTEYQRLSKLKSGYVDSWTRLMDDIRLLHTSYRFVRTLRISSRDPNLQTIPRAFKGPEALRLRSLIIPHDPFEVMFCDPNIDLSDDPEELALLEIDYSQAELRKTAEESGDPELIRCYLARRDVHKRTGAFMQGVSEDEIDWGSPEGKEVRQKAKVPNFGLIYGLSWHGLQEKAFNEYGLKLSDDEAKSMHAAWFRLYKGVRKYHKIIIAQAERTGYTTINWEGEPYFKRPVFDITSSDRMKAGNAARIAMNTPIQGGASLYMMHSIVSIYKELRKGNLKSIVGIVGTVHDSVWLLVWRSKVKKAFNDAGRIMLSWKTQRGVPYEVDGKAGQSLGSMEEIGSLNSMDLDRKKSPLLF